MDVRQPFKRLVVHTDGRMRLVHQKNCNFQRVKAVQDTGKIRYVILQAWQTADGPADMGVACLMC